MPPEVGEIPTLKPFDAVLLGDVHVDGTGVRGLAIRLAVNSSGWVGGDFTAAMGNHGRQEPPREGGGNQRTDSSDQQGLVHAVHERQPGRCAELLPGGPKLS